MPKLNPQAFPTRFLITQSTLEPLQNALGLEGIPVIVWKGPHVALTLYDSPIQRPWCDLDLLVRPRDFIRACGILPHHGHPLAPQDNLPISKLRRSFCVTFGSSLGLPIELHQDFSEHHRYPVDIDSMFERAVPFRFGTLEAMGLCPDDLLLSLVIHVVKSYFVSIEPKHFQDIHRLISRCAIVWPTLLAQFQTARCSVGTYFVLSVCQSQYGTSIPEDVMRALRPSWFRRSWLNALLDTTSFPVCRMKSWSPFLLRAVLGLPLTDRPGDAIGLVIRYAVIRLQTIRRRAIDLESRS